MFVCLSIAAASRRQPLTLRRLAASWSRSVWGAAVAASAGRGRRPAPGRCCGPATAASAALWQRAFPICCRCRCGVYFWGLVCLVTVPHLVAVMMLSAQRKEFCLAPAKRHRTHKESESQMETERRRERERETAEEREYSASQISSRLSVQQFARSFCRCDNCSAISLDLIWRQPSQ